MKKVFLFVAVIAQCFWAIGASAADDGEFDCVTTEWKAIGANHRVCVHAYTDPKIPQVTCYVSQARTGGIKGSVGLAEDPNNFAISCVRTGPVSLAENFPKREQVFKESTNILFKATRVTRLYDPVRKTLIYLAVSRHIIEGSPFNAVSAVSLE